MAPTIPRPEPLPVNLDQIPSALTIKNNWVLWRYTWKEGTKGKPGKWDKPPYQPNGNHASATAKHTWSSFKLVEEVYERGLNLPADDPRHYDGVGFVPHTIGRPDHADRQIVFGDLDHCRDKESGAISSEAMEDLKSINSYCEPSPSGTGLRFVAYGAPPFPPKQNGRKKGHIEIYQGGRYLTITGQRLPDFPATIEKRTDELNAFYEKHFSKSKPDKPKEESTHTPPPARPNGPKLTDEQIIALAAQAHNSPKFLSLMSGSIEGYLSQSEADLALCQLIAFYTPDPVQIDSIFRRSKLCRDKWERADYQERTIRMALERTTDHYRGGVAKDIGPEENEDSDAAADEAEAKAGKEEPIIQTDVGDTKYDKEGKPNGYKLSATKAARAVVKMRHLAMSEDATEIYRFDGQIYRPDGERVIDMTMCTLMGDDVTILKLKEILRRVRNELLNKPVVFDPNPCLLGVKNGVVDLSTGTFREYRPDDLITDRIDVTYDQKAKCPRSIQFLEETVPAVVDRLMLVDWFAIHAIRLMFAYVLFLLGLGRNGKGIFERLMKRFFKEESFIEMPLEELNVKNNRFAGAALKGKRGHIVSEAGDERHPGSKRTIPTNYLKFSTGDGTIDSDQKGTVRTRFKPFYKATIDCNDMPLIGDSSPGWIERFCKANMPFKFVDNPAPDTLERKKDPHLFEKLTTDAELSGILNLIISRAPTLIQTRAITKRPGAEMFAEYQKQSSSVKTFLEMFCDYKPVSDKSKDIFLDLIFEKYEAWCDRTVADKVDGIRFGKAVKTFCKGTEPERVLDGDKKRRIYHGLSFDINRYQALMDHNNTIKRPLKTVTGPLGPLNEEIWADIVEKYGDISTVIKEEMDFTPFLASMDPIAIPKIVNGPDSGFNGRCGHFIGPDSDFAEKGGIGPHPRKTEPTPADPETARLRAGHAKHQEKLNKRHCAGCGRDFDHDLDTVFNGKVSVFHCSTCFMQGPPSEPQKADAQTRIGEVPA